MRAVDFAYWLQGFFEVAQAQYGNTRRRRNQTSLNARQVEIIKNHLALVFKHEIDPSMDGGDPVKKAELQAVHDGKAGEAKAEPEPTPEQVKAALAQAYKDIKNKLPPPFQGGGWGTGGTVYRC